MRMVTAMADVMTERGFAGTSVAHVIARAGVSRETFYQQFSSKLDCFLAAFDAAGEVLLTGLGGVVAGGGTPLERFDRALTAYLDSLATNAAYARLFLVEAHAAGAPALERRLDVQRRIVDTLVDVLDAGTDAGRFACEVLVAAVGAMVVTPLVRGDTDALRALHDPVVDLVRRALAAPPP
jgi:AcrR family transcriptional regulator